MRLVAWNANFNNRPRELEETAKLLGPLHADLIVLSETKPPKEGNSLNAVWIGEGQPGLAVIAREGIILVAHSANVGAPTLMGGFYVRGDLNFSLLSVWPVQRVGDPTYHQVLMAGLSRFSDFLGHGRAIMAGDFNSNTRVSGQERSHPKFVQAADDSGLVSA